MALAAGIHGHDETGHERRDGDDEEGGEGQEDEEVVGEGAEAGVEIEEGWGEGVHDRVEDLGNMGFLVSEST